MAIKGLSTGLGTLGAGGYSAPNVPTPRHPRAYIPPLQPPRPNREFELFASQLVKAGTSIQASLTSFSNVDKGYAYRAGLEDQAENIVAIANEEEWTNISTFTMENGMPVPRKAEDVQADIYKTFIEPKVAGQSGSYTEQYETIAPDLYLAIQKRGGEQRQMLVDSILELEVEGIIAAGEQWVGPTGPDSPQTSAGFYREAIAESFQTVKKLHPQFQNEPPELYQHRMQKILFEDVLIELVNTGAAAGNLGLFTAMESLYQDQDDGTSDTTFTPQQRARVLGVMQGWMSKHMDTAASAGGLIPFDPITGIMYRDMDPDQIYHPDLMAPDGSPHPMAGELIPQGAWAAMPWTVGDYDVSGEAYLADGDTHSLGTASSFQGPYLIVRTPEEMKAYLQSGPLNDPESPFYMDKVGQAAYMARFDALTTAEKNKARVAQVVAGGPGHVDPGGNDDATITWALGAGHMPVVGADGIIPPSEKQTNGVGYGIQLSLAGRVPQVEFNRLWSQATNGPDAERREALAGLIIMAQYPDPDRTAWDSMMQHAGAEQKVWLMQLQADMRKSGLTVLSSRADGKGHEQVDWNNLNQLVDMSFHYSLESWKGDTDALALASRALGEGNADLEDQVVKVNDLVKTAMKEIVTQRGDLIRTGLFGLDYFLIPGITGWDASLTMPEPLNMAPFRDIYSYGVLEAANRPGVQTDAELQQGGRDYLALTLKNDYSLVAIDKRATLVPHGNMAPHHRWNSSTWDRLETFGEDVPSFINGDGELTGDISSLEIDGAKADPNGKGWILYSKGMPIMWRNPEYFVVENAGKKGNIPEDMGFVNERNQKILSKEEMISLRWDVGNIRTPSYISASDPTLRVVPKEEQFLLDVALLDNQYTAQGAKKSDVLKRVTERIGSPSFGRRVLDTVYKYGRSREMPATRSNPNPPFSLHKY